MRERVLSKIAYIVHDHAFAVLAMALIITVIGAIISSTTSVKLNWTDMLPEGHDMLEASERIEREMGGSDYLITLVRNEEDIETAKKVSDDFAKILGEDEDIEYVLHRIDIDYYRESSLYFLTDSELRSLKKEVELLFETDPQIASMLIGDEIIAMDELLMESLGFGYNSEGYMVSKNNDYFLIIAKPVTSAFDYDFTMPFGERMNELMEEKGEQYKGTEVLMGGNYYFAYEEKKAVDSDVILILILAIILIMTIIALAFGSLSYPIISLLSLGMAVIWTLAMMKIVVGYLNYVTSIMGVILLGIAVEYAIQIVSRYREEMELHGSIRESLRRAISKTGMAVMTSAFTTSAAFFMIILGESRMFKQTGLFLGVGVLACMISMFLVLPAMIAIKEKKFPVKVKAEKSRLKSLEKLGENILKYRWAYIGFAVAITIICAYGVTIVGYDYNVYNIEPEGLMTEKTNTILVDDFGMSFDFAVAFADDIEEARELVDDFDQLEVVGKVESIVDLLPANVEEKKEIIHSLNLRAEESEVWNQLDSEVRDTLEGMFRAEPPVLEAFPEDVLQKYVGAEGSYIIYIYPSEDPWEEKFLGEFTRDIRDIDESASGSTVIFYDLVGIIKDDFAGVTLFSMLAVLLILLIDFKSFYKAIYAFLPLGLAVLWMVGMMGLTGFKFDIVNILVTPMIVGMGIDFGVIAMHRFIEEGETAEGIPVALSSSGRAILVSGLVTISVFASLLLAKYRGFQNMGATAAMGLLFAVIAALTVLPAVLAVLTSRKKNGDNGY